MAWGHNLGPRKSRVRHSTKWATQEPSSTLIFRCVVWKTEPSSPCLLPSNTHTTRVHISHTQLTQYIHAHVSHTYILHIHTPHMHTHHIHAPHTHTHTHTHIRERTKEFYKILWPESSFIWKIEPRGRIFWNLTGLKPPGNSIRSPDF